MADCPRWHTINPLETWLQQVADWHGLDLTGTELCLSDAAVPQPQPPPAAPQAPAPQSAPANGGS